MSDEYQTKGRSGSAAKETSGDQDGEEKRNKIPSDDGSPAHETYQFSDWALI